MLMPKRDRIQTAAVVLLVSCGLGLFLLIRAAQIAHVSFD